MKTHNNFLSVVFLAVGLAGCVAGSGFQSARVAPVLDGALNLGIPAGYCIDRAASREQRDTSVTIMGRCADDIRAVPAVVTLSVGRGGSAGIMAAGGPALAEFFTSRQGRATLSRGGRANDVRVIEALSSGTAFLLRLQDKQNGEYWRAVLGVAGRLVTISVTGSPEKPLPATEGRKVLDQTLKAMQAANPG